MDYILRASAGDGAVRIFVANTHDTVQKHLKFTRLHQ